MDQNINIHVFFICLYTRRVFCLTSNTEPFWIRKNRRKEFELKIFFRNIQHMIRYFARAHVLPLKLSNATNDIHRTCRLISYCFITIKIVCNQLAY